MSTTTRTRAPAPVEHRPERRREISDRAKAEARLGVLLSTPAVLVMLLVAGYPILTAVYLSLFDYRLTDPSARAFVGLDNYRVILTDNLWWSDFSTTFVITAITVAAELALGFAFALIMHNAVFGRGAVRTAILIPYAVITVVSAYAWQYAFATDSGFVNPWLGLNTDWFGGRATALAVICFSEVWKTTSFVSLLLLAGLAQVPDELQQAAIVDGASWWQRFRNVTLPSMSGAILVALLFRTIDAFRIFDNVFIMTHGANDTETLSILAYRQTVSRVEIGLGSAVSILLFLSILLICVIFIRGFHANVGATTGGE
jgi:multiple sugar transport system permease protein